MATVQLIRNVGLSDAATSTQTSTVGEPCVATAGDNVFMTGNWYASSSADGGANWSHVDPFTTLPSAAGGFCCDQLVLYEPSRDIFIWLLQYVETGGSNVFRVAVSRGATPGDRWWWDFAPTDVDTAWTDAWFDYPDAAVSRNHLYVTFNLFNTSDAWLRAVVFKMPLDQLRDAAPLNYQSWSTTTHGSLRLTQNALDSMFFASHNGGTQLRVFGWPDGSNSIGSMDVTVGAWSSGPYAAPGPGGLDWLGRLDSRITGGWVSGTRAGFLWTAASGDGRPMPYVKGAVVDTVTGTLVEEPEIWNQTSAFAYPSACPNANGILGISVLFGGGSHHPSHVVGFRDGAEWRLVIARASTHGVPEGVSGDYLWCAQAHPQTSEWVASGFTLQGGSARQNVEPQYVRFGVG